MKNRKLTQYVVAALLIAIALIIPTTFGFLRVVIPPFTATIASHVPVFIAMMISPFVALLVGIGSTVSFLIAGMPLVVVARASSHIVWCLIGAFLLKKKMGYVQVVLITMVIHGVYEGLISIPFMTTWNDQTIKLILITAFGTMIHHVVDAIIALAIAKPLEKAIHKELIHKLW